MCACVRTYIRVCVCVPGACVDHICTNTRERIATGGILVYVDYNYVDVYKFIIIFVSHNHSMTSLGQSLIVLPTKGSGFHP